MTRYYISGALVLAAIIVAEGSIALAAGLVAVAWLVLEIKEGGTRE